MQIKCQLLIREIKTAMHIFVWLLMECVCVCVCVCVCSKRGHREEMDTSRFKLGSTCLSLLKFLVKYLSNDKIRNPTVGNKKLNTENLCPWKGNWKKRRREQPSLNQRGLATSTVINECSRRTWEKLKYGVHKSWKNLRDLLKILCGRRKKKKHVAYWGPENILSYRSKFIRDGVLKPEICANLSTCEIPGLSGKYSAILNISRTG